MKTANNIPVYNISWLNYTNGGTIGCFYEPESREELIVLCKDLYKKGKKFDIVGYTSNIYFLPSYSVDIMVSTRKVRDINVGGNYIVADCGASVKKLARQMVKEGIKGYEGLVDLPGTIAASVYGNASCYSCSINELLISFDVLRPDGLIVTMSKEDLKLSTRSTSFKRGEQKGVILSAKLRRFAGDKNAIIAKAKLNHEKRKNTQPPAQNNLGSIYCSSSAMTFVGYIIKGLVYVYGLFGSLIKLNKEELNKRKKHLMLSLIGAKDLIPYVYSWNRFIWKDADAHRLFWKFHRKHQLLFKNSDFEIEIKGNI